MVDEQSSFQYGRNYINTIIVCVLILFKHLAKAISCKYPPPGHTIGGNLEYILQL